jgi:hypothetical protein
MNPHLIVLICDNIPNQKFWDGSDWSSDLNQAVFPLSYEKAGWIIWKEIPEEKATHRITALPKRVYLRLLEEKGFR